MNVPSRLLMPVIRDAIARGQKVRMPVTGQSMAPFVPDGSSVMLERTESTLKAGDIVLVRRSSAPVESFVLHRVVRIEGGAFYLCGDSHRETEGPFRNPDVVATATSVFLPGAIERRLDRGRWRVLGRLWALRPALLRALTRAAGAIKFGGNRPAP